MHSALRFFQPWLIFKSNCLYNNNLPSFETYSFIRILSPPPSIPMSALLLFFQLTELVSTNFFFYWLRSCWHTILNWESKMNACLGEKNESDVDFEKVKRLIWNWNELNFLDLIRCVKHTASLISKWHFTLLLAVVFRRFHRFGYTRCLYIPWPEGNQEEDGNR